MPDPVDRYTWRLAIVGDSGPRNATTRHLLLTLSLSMNSAGDSAWPSQKTLAARCLISRRTVVTHLELAERTEWLARELGPKGGKGWRLTSYCAVVPENVYLDLPERPWEADPKWRRGERPSPRYVQVERPTREGGEPDAPKVVNGAHEGGATDAYRGEPGATVTLPLNSSSVTSPKREGALARTAAVDKSTKTSKTKNEEPAHISTVLPTHGAASQESGKVKTKNSALRSALSKPKPVVDVEANRTATLAELRKRMAP